MKAENSTTRENTDTVNTQKKKNHYNTNIESRRLYLVPCIRND